MANINWQQLATKATDMAGSMAHHYGFSPKSTILIPASEIEVGMKVIYVSASRVGSRLDTAKHTFMVASVTNDGNRIKVYGDEDNWFLAKPTDGINVELHPYEIDRIEAAAHRTAHGCNPQYKDGKPVCWWEDSVE